jgi:hypothetical protein
MRSPDEYHARVAEVAALRVALEDELLHQYDFTIALASPAITDDELAALRSIVAKCKEAREKIEADRARRRT